MVLARDNFVKLEVEISLGEMFTLTITVQAECGHIKTKFKLPLSGCEPFINWQETIFEIPYLQIAIKRAGCKVMLVCRDFVRHLARRHRNSDEYHISDHLSV